MKTIITAGVLCLTVAASSAAEIQVTFTNEVVRKLPSFRVEGGFLQMAEGRVDLSRITSVQFVADPLPEDIDGGEEGMMPLQKLQPSLLAAAGLKGNAREFLHLLLRAYFWRGDYPAAEALIQAGRAVTPLPAATVYEALIQIDQNRFHEVEALLAAAESSGESPVAIDYVRARAAFSQENHKEALRYLARVALAGSRDAEWTPAAIFLEGMIYKTTGQHEAAAYAANELRERYSGGYWSRRAEELK